MNGQESPLTIRRLVPNDEKALAVFFTKIASDPASSGFHPHPLDDAQARKIARWAGRDIYVGAFRSGRLVGYGMLRGWDDGWQVPSLGICLLPSMRGKGLSVPLMQEMHDLARREGAERVRLKVYSQNNAAIRLYQRFGYVFVSEEAGQLVGLLNLAPEKVN